jgi:hypothetical protein
MIQECLYKLHWHDSLEEDGHFSDLVLGEGGLFSYSVYIDASDSPKKSTHSRE